MRARDVLRMLLAMTLAWVGLRLTTLAARVAAPVGARAGARSVWSVPSTTDTRLTYGADGVPGEQLRLEAYVVGCRWHGTFCRREGRA